MLAALQNHVDWIPWRELTDGEVTGAGRGAGLNRGSQQAWASRGSWEGQLTSPGSPSALTLWGQRSWANAHP